MHKFDAGQNCSRRAKRFEAEHRPGKVFDGTVTLLHDIVEVFHLPDLDRDFSLRIQLVKRCHVSAALVHRHGVGNLVVPYGLVEEAPGC